MIQHFDELRGILRIEIKRRQRLRLFVLDAVNAREVMVAVGARGGVVRAVRRAPRVVVDADLVVKIHEVKRAVRADAAVDGLEPIIRAREKMGLLAASFLVALIAHAFLPDEFLVH